MSPTTATARQPPHRPGQSDTGPSTPCGRGLPRQRPWATVAVSAGSTACGRCRSGPASRGAARLPAAGAARGRPGHGGRPAPAGARQPADRLPRGGAGVGADHHSVGRADNPRAVPGSAAGGGRLPVVSTAVPTQTTKTRPFYTTNPAAANAQQRIRHACHTTDPPPSPYRQPTRTLNPQSRGAPELPPRPQPPPPNPARPSLPARHTPLCAQRWDGPAMRGVARAADRPDASRSPPALTQVIRAGLLAAVDGRLTRTRGDPLCQSVDSGRVVLRTRFDDGPDQSIGVAGPNHPST